MTWKKFRNEGILFLICFGVSLFVLFPLMAIFFGKEELAFYPTLIKHLYDNLIFKEGVTSGFGLWLFISGPWFIIQSTRFLVWVFSIFKQTLILFITKRGEIQVGRGFSTGFIVGVSLLGGIWWWTQKIDNPNYSDDPYYSVQDTNPKHWLKFKGDNATRKSFDVKDCHQSVAYIMSKHSLRWQQRVDEFRSCMDRKGYLFFPQ